MPLHRLLVPALFVLTSFSLAGCATTGGAVSMSNPPSAAAAATGADRPVAPYREAVTLAGRMTANFKKDGNQESVTVKFNWVQAADRLDIELATPFGQTVATIAITPTAATLTQPNKAPLTAPTIDALSEQAMGWALPVAGLRQWLQGYANKQDGSRFVASPRFNQVETQDGWRLRYVAWQDEAAAVPLPRRIDAERIVTGPAHANVDELAIRVIIDSWE